VVKKTASRPEFLLETLTILRLAKGYLRDGGSMLKRITLFT
jgi:hypothetical protein